MQLVNNSNNRYIIILLIAVMIYVSTLSVDAYLGSYPPNSCVQIKTILNATSVNISTLSYPNGSIFISNQAMTKLGQTFYFNFCNTSILGNYVYDYFDDNGNVYVNDFDIGFKLNLPEILVYLFFLILCLVILYLSLNLFKKNKFSKDVVKGQELYEAKKRNEFLYYAKLLKQRMWIVGVFGIYVSLLVFTALLDQLLYHMNLTDLHNLFTYIPYFMAWGLIPFILFWFIWLIFVFYNSTKDILKYQFGSFKHER